MRRHRRTCPLLAAFLGTLAAIIDGKGQQDQHKDTDMKAAMSGTVEGIFD
jgi:hypothetical protein